ETVDVLELSRADDKGNFTIVGKAKTTNKSTYCWEYYVLERMGTAMLHREYTSSLKRSPKTQTVHGSRQCLNQCDVSRY
ncbi:hypothetical protein BIW11_09649, partial [Tropilaelaps mercedesae]